MAFVSQTRAGNLGTILVEDTSTDSTVQYAKSGSTTLFAVQINNTSNAQVYLKFWDATSGVTVGTTAPVVVLACAASSKRSYMSPQGMVTLGTGLAYACVTTGGTGGTSNPAAAVDLMISLS
jgi:hypothetical protein